MEIIYTNGMITINETIVVILVSFLVLVFILNRLMFRPLRDVIEQRATHFSALDRDITTARDKTTDLSARLRQKEEAARQEGLILKNELETAANQQAKEIVDITRGEIAGLKESTQKEIDIQIAEAKKVIHQEAQRLSMEIVSKILGREIA